MITTITKCKCGNTTYEAVKGKTNPFSDVVNAVR